MDHGTSHAPCSAPFLGGPSLVNVCNADSASLFLTMLNTLAAYSPVISDPCHRLKPIREPSSSYDFIVIGGKTVNINVMIISSLFDLQLKYIKFEQRSFKLRKFDIIKYMKKNRISR